MQTLLGSGGSIGTELARILKEYTGEIKLVSRNPVKVNDSDLLYPADLTDAVQLDNAIEHSDICYVTVGFQYSTRVWQKTWLPFMRNVVDSCKKHRAKLVFFDNVYAIGGDHVKHITEESPISPTSKKGEVRAAVDRLILEEVEKGNLQAIIARAPDFFGPVNKQNSVLLSLVYDNLVKGKAAQWFCNADVVHTIGYTPDLARGTAMLGNSGDAWNQVWNLPVDSQALTGRQWVELFAAEMQAPVRLKVLPLWALKLLGLFIPVLAEMPEMMYQFDRPYVFDSSKFNEKFKFEATPNREAVRQTLEALSANKK